MKIYQLVALCLLQLTACSELFSNLAQLNPTNVNISIFKCHPQCQWKCDEPHCPGNIIKASFKRDYGGDCQEIWENDIYVFVFFHLKSSNFNNFSSY